MAEFTKISWADKTHNEWIGCTRLSPACDFCYAENLMDTRLGRVEWGAPGQGEGTRSLTSESNRRRPYQWDRAAKASGDRPLVFTLSLGDVFDNAVPDRWRADLFSTIRATPHLYWLVLTKRPFNVLPMFWGQKGHQPLADWPKNAALGATCEDRERLAQNAPTLISVQNQLGVPALFVSYEPALEPIADLAEEFMRPWGQQGIGWWLCGGESRQGPGHIPREADPNWFRDMQAACDRTGALFHLKQMTNRREIPEDLRRRDRPEVARFCA